MKYSTALLGLVPAVAAQAQTGNWSAPLSLTNDGTTTSTIYISVWATETSAVPTTIPTVIDRVVSSDNQVSTLSETSQIESTITELVTVLVPSTASPAAQTVDVYNKLAVANRINGDSSSSVVSYSNTTTTSQSVAGNWSYSGIGGSSTDIPSTSQIESQGDGNKAVSTAAQSPATSAGSVSPSSTGSSSNNGNSGSSGSGSNSNSGSSSSSSAPISSSNGNSGNGNGNSGGSSLTFSASAQPTTLVTVNNNLTTTIQMTRTVFYDANGGAYSTQGVSGPLSSTSAAAAVPTSAAPSPSATMSTNSSTSLNSTHLTNSTVSNSSLTNDLQKREVQDVFVDSYRSFIETKPKGGEAKHQQMMDEESALSYNYIPFDFKTGACKTRRQISKDFESIRAHGHESVRIYSIDECGDLLENVGHAARTKGLKLILGIDFVHSQSLESMKLAVDNQVTKMSSQNYNQWELVDRIVLGRDLISSGALKNVQEMGELLQHATRILSRQHFYKAVSVGETYGLFQLSHVRDQLCKSSLSIDLSMFEDSIKEDQNGQEAATSSVKNALAEIDSITGFGICAGHRIHLGIEGSGYCQPNDGFFSWLKL